LSTQEARTVSHASLSKAGTRRQKRRQRYVAILALLLTACAVWLAVWWAGVFIFGEQSQPDLPICWPLLGDKRLEMSFSVDRTTWYFSVNYDPVAGLPDEAYEAWYAQRPVPIEIRSLGFYLLHGDVSVITSLTGRWQGARTTVIGIPNVLALVMLGAFPIIWARRYLRRHHRMTHGLCLSCGYDLRFSKTSCPECGAAMTSPSQNSSLSTASA
jgi:hypothetical protein